jgi:hypothetical protein
MSDATLTTQVERSFAPRISRRIPSVSDGLHVRFYEGVDDDVRRSILSLVRFLRTRHTFHDPVLITVAPHDKIRDGNGLWTWGVFLVPDGSHESGDPIRIYLAAGALRRFRELRGVGHARSVREILLAVCHELVHYRQWRGRRPLSEEEAERVSAEELKAYLKWRRTQRR